MKGKELVVVGEVVNKPQYGGRTLVEKVKAYRLSDGELVANKKNALRYQKELDKDAKIEMIIMSHLKPFKSTKVTDDGLISIENDMVPLWRVRQLLSNFDELMGVDNA
jgi:hypothetical protein